MQAGGSDRDDLDDVADSTDDLDEIDDGVESSSNENNNTITGTNNSSVNASNTNKSTNNGSAHLTANPNGSVANTLSLLSSTSSNNNSVFPEDDKRKRRAIANSNERRRMQSINAGFQNLKSLIPHSSGEKLSKACILQRSADYMQHLNREKEKLASNLQIAMKILETNGLSTQFQSQVNLDSYKLSSTSTSTTSNNSKLNKQLIINISSVAEPQSVQSQSNNNEQLHSAHEQVSPKVTSPKNQQSHHTATDYTTALISSKRRSINSICSSPPQQQQGQQLLQSSTSSTQQPTSTTTSSIVSLNSSTTTPNQKVSAQSTVVESLTANNTANVVKSENACSLTSILPVVTQQNTMPNDNICCLIALPNLDHPKVNSPIIDANDILTAVHSQNDEKCLNPSTTNKKRDTADHSVSLVSCSSNNNNGTTNRQLTDTTNQIKKPYTISTTPSLITNITSSQPSSNPNGGNLLILPADSSTIQLITTATSGQHQSTITNSPEFIKSSRTSCVNPKSSSKKIADIDLAANTPQFIDTASIPATTKLPANILIKLVESLRSNNNTTATTLFPNSTTIQMIHPTTEQMKHAQSNPQIALAASQGQIVLIESSSNAKNTKTNTAASDADDENDDFENEDIDLDLDSYHSDTNQPPPNKRSILTIQTSTTGGNEICLVDEDLSQNRSTTTISKSTKIRHINHHHLINSPGNYGHQQQKSSRSNSIDQLIAAAAVTSAQSPTESSANASSNECQSNLSVRKNLNTIVEAIKHVEGFVDPYSTGVVTQQNSVDLTTTANSKTCQVSSSGDDNPNLSSVSSNSSTTINSSNNSLKQPALQQITAEQQQAHKPPKKRKYTTEDSVQNTTNTELMEQNQSSIQHHPSKIGILSLNQQQHQTPLQQSHQASTPAMCYIEIAQLNELIKIAASSDLEKLVQPYLLAAASGGTAPTQTPMTMSFGSIVCGGNESPSSNATRNHLSNIVVVSSSDDPSAAVVPLAAVTSNQMNSDSKGSNSSGSATSAATDEKKINVLVTS